MKKLKLRKKLSFSFFKTHKALSLILLLIGIGAFIAFSINFAKYSYDVIYTYYLRTQNFYFNSNRLVHGNKTYSINPWPGSPNSGGVDNSQNILIEVNSKDNSLNMTTVPVFYKATVTCDNPSKVLCYIVKSDDDTAGYTRKSDELTSTIPVTNDPDTTNKDSFKVVVEAKPTVVGGDTSFLRDGDTIKVEVKATSSSPYVSELKATYIITVGNYGVKYSIKNFPSYIDTLVTNSLPSDVFVGLEIPSTSRDKVSYDMSNVFTLHPASDRPSMITDPSVPRDTQCYLNTSYVSSENYSCIYKVDSNGYVTSLYYKLGSKSSMLVRYYKLNFVDEHGTLFSARSQNYTYNTGDAVAPIVKYCKLEISSLNGTVGCP